MILSIRIVTILALLEQRAHCGVEIMEKAPQASQLREGKKFSAAYLYQTLHRMEAAGLIKRQKYKLYRVVARKPVGSKTRIYYDITDRGRQMLKEFRDCNPVNDKKVS